MTTETPGTRIQTKRQDAGLSRTALGTRCDWGDQGGRRVRRYEIGERTPDWTAARALAEALGTTVGYLMYGEEEAARVEQIPVADVAPHLRNPRKGFDDDQLAQLADSISAHGILQPITVATNGRTYTIICGERRWRAAQKAGLVEIPAIVRDDLNGEQQRALQIVENLQRVNLSLPEIIAGVADLCAEHTHEQVAWMLGRSRSWVSRRAGLRHLNDQVQHAIDNGWINDVDAAHALDSLFERDPRWAIEFIDRFVQPDEANPTRAEIQYAVDRTREHQQQAERDAATQASTTQQQPDRSQQESNDDAGSEPPPVQGEGRKRQEDQAAAERAAEMRRANQHRHRLHLAAKAVEQRMRPLWRDDFECHPTVDAEETVDDNPDADEFELRLVVRGRRELDNAIFALRYVRKPTDGAA